MIQRTETFNIELTPRELEQELWCMDSLEQAELLLAMVQRYNKQTSDVLYQLDAVTRDFCNKLNDDERRDAIMLFGEIVDYLKEADKEYREWESRGKE